MPWYYSMVWYWIAGLVAAVIVSVWTFRLHRRHKVSIWIVVIICIALVVWALSVWKSVDYAMNLWELQVIRPFKIPDRFLAARAEFRYNSSCYYALCGLIALGLSMVILGFVTVRLRKLRINSAGHV